MNLTMVSALTLLVVWILLVFVAQLASGSVHLLYAAATILLARRIVVGAPQFLS